MNLDDALAFWYGRIDYERRSPKPGDLKLDRMRSLLRGLGDPHLRIRTVHVAGTKGKGSTSAMLAETLRRAGYRVGLFTSPHLVSVTERMQVNGQPITPAELIARMQDVRPVVEAMTRSGEGNAPTFFEVGTAVGFLHFVCRNVDVAVIEVGLGGRFDSTNVVQPMVSVITSISFDHMAQLGNTLTLIAREKAGIIKPGRPVVATMTAEEARAVVISTAAERGSRLSLIDRDFTGRYLPSTEPLLRPARVAVQTSRSWPPMELALLGEHQAQNAAGVVKTVELLTEQGLTIPDSAVAAGLGQVRWPARMEIMGRRPLVVLDCAHNVASVQAMAETFHHTLPVKGMRRLIFAASADKDVPGMLRVLAPHFDAFTLTRFAENPRSVDPQQLADWLRPQIDGRPMTIVMDAPQAWQQVWEQAKPDDGIGIVGSVFLAGELRNRVLADCQAGHPSQG
ncbi:bifunctional folylpolyglutamate synthase/dihydrofolate synthase [Tuwongella immobilis]|nr:folylpolyglutamate synthase/dihydrofolate synthase family protein [Tuwongella immobilis]